MDGAWQFAVPVLGSRVRRIPQGQTCQTTEIAILYIGIIPQPANLKLVQGTFDTFFFWRKKVVDIFQNAFHKLVIHPVPELWLGDPLLIFTAGTVAMLVNV